MPEHELSIVFPQSQSKTQTEDYLQAPCVSMDTNPANYCRENERKYPLLAKVAKEVLSSSIFCSSRKAF